MTDLNQQDRAEFESDNERIGKAATLYARLLAEKRQADAARGFDQGPEYYIRDAIRRAVEHLYPAACRQHGSAAQAVGYVSPSALASLKELGGEGMASSVRMYFAADQERGITQPVFAAPPVATQAAQAVGEVVSSYLGGGQYIPAVRWLGTPPESGTKLFTAPPVADTEGVKELLATDVDKIRRTARNQVCIDGHLNETLDAVMRSNSPDGTFNLLGTLAGEAIDIALDLAALSRRPVAAPEAPADPMDWTLPCEITVGAGTFAKGVKLRALVARMNVMNDMIREGWSSARADSAAPLPVAEPELLPLPKAYDTLTLLPGEPIASRQRFTADQMHAYARAHLSAAGQGEWGTSQAVLTGKAEIEQQKNQAARTLLDNAAGQGKDSERLDEFAKHPNWELSADYDEDDLTWRVHKVVGSRNDREWVEIGRGETPRAAIDAAKAQQTKGTA